MTANVITDKDGHRIGIGCGICEDTILDGQWTLAEEYMERCKVCKNYYCERCVRNKFFEIDVCKNCMERST